VVIVLIFAEIAPLFAGRRYAEHAAMIGIPILYGASILLRPVIWLFDLLCRAVHWFLRSPQDVGLYLSREELQKILEEGQEEELSTVVANIFTLKSQVAKDLMKPLSFVQLVPSICTVSEMRSLLTSKEASFVPIYHKEPKNIVAVAYPRDLLRLSENKKVRDHARPPWFITESDGIMAILKQFRTNSQSVAIVLSDKGLATGVLLLDEIIDEIFGQEDSWISMGDMFPSQKIVVDRSFPGDMPLHEFNALYQVNLALEGAETLSDLVTQTLGHLPAIGESIKIDPFEFTVEEVSLLGAKLIAVRS
jgi:CBS domain containing-hemolysin-like protein